jgi:hypothetical protein
VSLECNPKPLITLTPESREEQPRMNFGISGIGISAFLLTRSRVLHIRSSEIAKHEISLEERFGISAFRGSGTREDSVLGSRVLDSRYPKVRNHAGRRIEGRLIAVDPVGDIVSEFQGLWRLGREPEALHQDSQNREARNLERRKKKSSDRSQSFAERFGIRHFDSCEDKKSGFLVPELPKSRNAI